jgi:hypothetical protein
MERGARFSYGECDADRLGSVSFYSPFFKTSFGLQVGWFVVCVKQWLDHCPWLLLQYRRQRLLWYILVRLVSLQCIAGYNNDPRTLTWGTPALIEESSVY